MRYSSSRRGGWATALEDSTGGAEVIGDAPVATFDINVSETDEDGAPLDAVDASGEPTVDVTLPETTEALDEVEDAEEVVDKLEETSEVLENYATAIESRIRENGGLTPSEWELVQIGLSSRIKNIRALTPSKESFGYSRLSATTEALDSIKEGIQRVWEAIKSAIMGVINRVRKWWAGAMSDAARLGKRAKGIRENAKKKSNSLRDGEKTVKLNAKNMVGENGKPMPNKQYVEAARTYSLIAANFLVNHNGEVTDQVDELASKVDTFVSDVAKNPKDVKIELPSSLLPKDPSSTAGDSTAQQSNQQATNAPRGLILPLNYANNSNSTSLPDASEVMKVIKGFPGAKNFVYSNWSEGQKPKNVSDVASYFRSIGTREFVNAETQPREVDKDLEFTVLEVSEIDEICGYIEDTCSAIVRYKQGFERREKTVDKFIKRMDSKVREVGRMDEFKGHSQAAALVNTYVRSSSDFTKNSLSRDARLITELLSKSKDMLAYAQRSSSLYES